MLLNAPIDVNSKRRETGIDYIYVVVSYTP